MTRHPQGELCGSAKLLYDNACVLLSLGELEALQVAVQQLRVAADLICFRASGICITILVRQNRYVYYKRFSV